MKVHINKCWSLSQQDLIQTDSYLGLKKLILNK